MELECFEFVVELETSDPEDSPGSMLPSVLEGREEFAEADVVVAGAKETVRPDFPPETGRFTPDVSSLVSANESTTSGAEEPLSCAALDASASELSEENAGLESLQEAKNNANPAKQSGARREKARAQI